MGRVKLLAAMLALVMPVVLIGGGAGQTQGPEGSNPPVHPPGTAPTGQEDALALPAGPAVAEAETILDASGYAIWNIPGGALKPRISNVEWQANWSYPGCVYASSGDYDTWWSAPLNLPVNSVIRYFRMYYNDQNPSVDCEAFLTEYDFDEGIVEEWGLQSSGTGRGYVTTEVNIEVFLLHSYAIHWRPRDLGSDMQVCGFQVFYEPGY